MRTIHTSDYVRVITYLKHRRQELGLTQAEVALKLGWGRSVVSKIETRERRADILETYLLCRLYELNLAALEAILAGEGSDHVAKR